MCVCVCTHVCVCVRVCMSMSASLDEITLRSIDQDPCWRPNSGREQRLRMSTVYNHRFLSPTVRFQLGNVNPGLINPWLNNRGCPLLVTGQSPSPFETLGS